MKLCCKKLFFYDILLFMGVVVKYPITLPVDNVGSILLLDNTLVYQQTKHTDICHPFICDYVEDRTEKNKNLCSEENLSDSFKNNLNNVPF